MRFNTASALILLSLSSINAFAPRSIPSSLTRKVSAIQNESTLLNMAGKKKRRRRKKTQSEPSTPSPTTIPELDTQIIPEGSMASSGEDMPSIEELKSIANFSPTGGNSAIDSSVPSRNLTPVGDGLIEAGDDTFLELPDIRDALKNKEMKKLEEEEKEKMARPKISRKDRKAMLQLLEEQPYADADDSYFEDEEYGTVSALLAEGARPFLGIPPGPLQVGHFIGALGIILCAFVEYPGFPLTNLPTPLRDALQGGLGTIYLINTILAVLATFKASERGQPAGLWAAKTFSVGGLAFDQLTQLPTLKEIEEMENRKGARAMKK